MSIENHTLSVKEVFNYYFVVPDYQRNFVWDTDQFGELTDSIIEFSKERKDSKYFLGAAVFQKHDGRGLPDNIGEAYYIVDGQQRLTSIFILVSAVINQLKQLEASSEDIVTLSSDYLSKHVIGAKKTTKLIHSDADSINAINKIMIGDDKSPGDISKSADRIYAAYRVIKEKVNNIISNTTKTKKSKIKELTDIIMCLERVVLLPFATDTQSESLEIFETLNSKGVELSNLDILKSLLFKNAGQEDEEDWEQLSTVWNKFYNEFEPLEIQPNKFLRFVCVTQFHENTPTKKSLEWIQNNENKTKIISDPKYFISMMTKTAKAIAMIRKGKDPTGTDHPSLHNLLSLAPSAEQHYYFLVPLWDLNPRIYNESFEIAESYIFVNKALTRYTGAIEKTFIEWGKELKEKSENSKLVKDYIDNTIWKEIRKEKDKLRSQLLTTSQSNNSKAFIVWMLQRVEQYAIEVSGIINTNGIDEIKGFDLEHIEHQTSTRLPKEMIKSLGNLTLWERGSNRGLKTALYDVKRPIYGTSRFKITNSLNIIPQNAGKDTAAFKLFLQADDWTENNINKRTNKIVDALLKALGLI